MKAQNGVIYVYAILQFGDKRKERTSVHRYRLTYVVNFVLRLFSHPRQRYFKESKAS